MTDEELAWQLHSQEMEDHELAEQIAASEAYAPANVDDVHGANEDDDPVARTPSQGGQGHGNDEGKKVECVACGGKVIRDKTTRAPCGHVCCGECVSELFGHAMRDESLFPPRCCQQPLALDKVRRLLDHKLAHEFATKSVELSTPDRTYCYLPRCSAFIRPTSVVGDVGTCEVCRRTTCTLCKARAHMGDCPREIRKEAWTWKISRLSALGRLPQAC